MSKKILVSGGHLTPALAVIDQAKIEHKDITFLFLGRTYSQDQSKQLSQEKAEIEKRGITFIPTVAPKFHKTFWWKNISEVTKWWPALKVAWQVTSRFKPDVFLSFGGYLAFPIALICRVRNIPIVTHEQTSSAGLANGVIAFLSAKIAVSYPSSMEHFPAHKTVLTGNPLRPSLLKTSRKKPSWIGTVDKPILYITGGNQGSEILNTVVSRVLPKLTSNWFVIHQCGNPNSHTDYEHQLLQAAQQLSANQQQNYVVRTWIAEEELSWIFSNARVVVSRSGANTVQELTYHAIPAVLIPLPFSHNQEQQKNAEVLQKAGSAVILEQRFLVPDSFVRAIQNVSKKYTAMHHKAELLKSDMIVDGTSRLIELVEQVIKEKRYYVEKE